MKKIIITTIIITILSVSLFGCRNNDKSYFTEVYVMDTYVTQRVYGENSENAAVKVNQLFKDIEDKLSLYKSDSEISKINKNAGKSHVKVSDFTYKLIVKGKEYSSFSSGSFDITVAPLTTLWGITSDTPRVPTETEISNALDLIDYSKIELNEQDRSVMLKDAGMAIDLGGVAKGYLMQIIKEEYTKFNINSAIVSIGGNIFAYGTKPDGSDFKIGIRDPLSDSANDIMGILKVKDEAISTTGAYERYFEENGQIYHHILDINTGYPVDSDLLSVTVISKDGGLADFLSTTLYIAGKDAIDKYINYEEFSVIVIDKNKNVYLSDSLKGVFEIKNDDYTLI